jgi:hypothetical protein
MLRYKSSLGLYSQTCIQWGGRRGRDHLIVGFTTTYAISADHH